MVTQPRLRALALAAISSLTAALIAGVPLSASADTAPASSSTPTTVSTDPLPTVQEDGVVWTQIVVGNTVYVGGSFANAYPAGSAKGTNLTPRANMLAYDLTTGNLVTSFAPSFNAQVRALAASPDGKTIYAGGNFTQVNGVNEYRTVALNAATGAVVTSFKATTDAAVTALAATASTLYIGGAYSSVNTVQRLRVAAVSATTGALNTSWVPNVPDGYVRGILVSPDGTKVALGGSFSSLNGATSPGRGLGMVDAATGTVNSSLKVGQTVQDYGSNSSIESLWSDGTSIYGSGYTYGTPGNFEGVFSASWTDGTINWLEDCHGDSYSVAGLGNAIYVATHAHFCENVPGGFAQTNASSTLANHQRAIAFTKNATGTLTANTYATGTYASFGGQPAPTELAWYPDLAAGTITGEDQAAWSVTTAGNYVLLGGEFPTVDGATQAGLVRFATSSIAPNTDGPRIGGSSWTPTVTATASGSLRVSAITNWDRDNAQLSYALYRDGGSTPIYTTAVTSNGFWNRPELTYVDSGLTVGSTHSYAWKATDPFGNSSYSGSASGTVGSVNPSAYANAVLGSGATDFWRLDGASGSTVADWAGGYPLSAGSGVTTGTAGAITGDADTASTFSGTSAGLASTQQIQKGPQTFSIETWFRTTTTSGGVLAGFGDQSSGTSSNHDRLIYMDTNGVLHFGVYSTAEQILSSSKALNDGKWHQVVGTLSSSGLALYIDGALVGSNSAVTSAQNFYGYWRLGGDTPWNGRTWFSGSLDDVSIYPKALSASQVSSHYSAATVAAKSVPTASMTASTSGLTVAVDGTSSSDTGSTISSYSWAFGDGGTGSGSTASHTYAAAGTYTVSLTVTDALGAANTTSRSVTVAPAATGATDSFSRSVTGGLGTADSGGAWTTSGGSSNLGVASGSARFSTAAATTLSGVLTSVSLASSDTSASIAVQSLPVGGSAFAGVIGRRVGSDDYSARVSVASSGAVSVQVLHGGTTLKSTTVAGITATAGTVLHLRLQVIGSGTTTLQARAWADGSAEPSTWQVSTTDTTAALQAAGSVGIRTYTGSGVTNGPVVTLFDDFTAATAQ